MQSQKNIYRLFSCGEFIDDTVAKSRDEAIEKFKKWKYEKKDCIGIQEYDTKTGKYVMLRQSEVNKLFGDIASGEDVD